MNTDTTPEDLRAQAEAEYQAADDELRRLLNARDNHTHHTDEDWEEADRKYWAQLDLVKELRTAMLD